MSEKGEKQAEQELEEEISQRLDSQCLRNEHVIFSDITMGLFWSLLCVVHVLLLGFKTGALERYKVNECIND